MIARWYVDHAAFNDTNTYAHIQSSFELDGYIKVKKVESEGYEKIARKKHQ